MLLVLAGGTYLGRNALLAGVGHLLVIHDPLERSDLIYVLNGDHDSRPVLAAQLYKAGMAPEVLIPRGRQTPSEVVSLTQNDSDISEETLKYYGVPESHILQLKQPGGVSSTFDEARLLREYHQRVKFQKVIVVTSELPSRRAGWIFRKVLGPVGVTVRVAPSREHLIGPDNWWTTELGVVACQNEYLKFAYYLMKY